MILRYASGSLLVVHYSSALSVKLVGYTNSDSAGDLGDRKSIGGYIFTINGKPVIWSSKKQASMALRTCEAEYVALTEAVKESMFLTLLFKYIASGVNTPVI